MDVDRVVIERHDGSEFCGVLVYSEAEQRPVPPPRMVTWTFTVNEQQKLLLVIYPASSSTPYTEIERHYRELADAILDAVFKAQLPG